MDVIAWLEFELSYFKAAVQHFSHYAMETPSIVYYIGRYWDKHDYRRHLLSVDMNSWWQRSIMNLLNCPTIILCSSNLYYCNFYTLSFNLTTKNRVYHFNFKKYVYSYPSKRYQEAKSYIFLSFRIFRLLSSTSWLYLQCFCRYVIQPSPGVSCWTRESPQNLKLNPLSVEMLWM